MRCPAAGEAERRAGELLITRAVHSLSCSVSNQGGSWGFRGIKYGLRVNHGRRGLVALTGNSVGTARGRQRGREGAEVRERRGRQRRQVGEIFLVGDKQGEMKLKRSL